MSSTLSAIIDFLVRFGLFDVILPFLLVFTIVFGILEKTRIFGVEEVDGKKYAKKNINSMVAFVLAFFVVAAKEIVTVIQTSLPLVALLLIIVFSFLLLAGSFMSDKEFSFENNTFWKVLLTTLMFIGIVGIFLYSLGWLDIIINYIATRSTPEGLGAFALVVLVLATIGYVVGWKKAPVSTEGGD
ncbi:MAG: hypothetical protein ABIF40_02945 [archaeon]